MGNGAARRRALSTVLCAALALCAPGLPALAQEGCTPAAFAQARATGVAAPICILSDAGLSEAVSVVARFSVELADDDAERAQGLMGRTGLGPGAGMLFLYPTPREVAFWMRNTRIPLDMLFIDAGGKIVRLHAGARPFDETPIPSGSPVQMVLEIAGGQAERLGIVPGMRLVPLP